MEKFLNQTWRVRTNWKKKGKKKKSLVFPAWRVPSLDTKLHIPFLLWKIQNPFRCFEGYLGFLVLKQMQRELGFTCFWIFCVLLLFGSWHIHMGFKNYFYWFQVLKDGLSAVHVPYAYGFAIILLTTLVKAATFPLTKKQVCLVLFTKFLLKFSYSIGFLPLTWLAEFLRVKTISLKLGNFSKFAIECFEFYI